MPCMFTASIHNSLNKMQLDHKIFFFFFNSCFHTHFKHKSTFINSSRKLCTCPYIFPTNNLYLFNKDAKLTQLTIPKPTNTPLSISITLPKSTTEPSYDKLKINWSKQTRNNFEALDTRFLLFSLPKQPQPPSI